MVTERAEDLDCFGISEDELEAAVQVFYVRRGRVVGRKGFIVDKVEDLTRPQLLADVLQQHYADPINGIPPLVLVPGEVDEPDVIEEWLTSLRAEAPLSKGAQNETGQNETGQNETGQNETGQNETGQNETGQNESGHDGVGLSSKAGRAEDAAGAEGVNVEVEVELEGSAPDTSWKEWWAASGRRRPERSVNPRSVGSSRAGSMSPSGARKKPCWKWCPRTRGRSCSGTG